MLFRRKNKKNKTNGELKVEFNRLNYSRCELNYLLEKDKPEKQQTCLSGYFKNIKGLIRS